MEGVEEEEEEEEEEEKEEERLIPVSCCTFLTHLSPWGLTSLLVSPVNLLNQNSPTRGLLKGSHSDWKEGR